MVLHPCLARAATASLHASQRVAAQNFAHVLLPATLRLSDVAQRVSRSHGGGRRGHQCFGGRFSRVIVSVSLCPEPIAGSPSNRGKLSDQPQGGVFIVRKHRFLLSVVV